MFKTTILMFSVFILSHASAERNIQLAQFAKQNNVIAESSTVIFSLDSTIQLMVKGHFLPEFIKEDGYIDSLVKMLGIINKKFSVSHNYYFSSNPSDTELNEILHKGIIVLKHANFNTYRKSAKNDTAIFIDGIQPVFPDLRKEYNEFRAGNKKGLSGQIVIKFYISETGKIDSLVVINNKLSNKKFAKKVIESLKTAQFKTDHVIEVEWPFNFMK